MSSNTIPTNRTPSSRVPTTLPATVPASPAAPGPTVVTVWRFFGAAGSVAPGDCCSGNDDGDSCSCDGGGDADGSVDGDGGCDVCMCTNCAKEFGGTILMYHTKKAISLAIDTTLCRIAFA